ncbi:MAG: dATP pyrophosphohydrolase [Bacteroidetes bacterium]|nr:dATP pyrophosphohydrolase [Bacteroidota bacterium]
MAIIVCRIIEVCVFRFVNNRSEYLMLRRSPGEKIYPNLWQFVSGSLHDGEKATDAALRELKEETGLTPKRFWVVPHANTFYDHSYDAVNVSPLFAAQVDPDDEPRLSAEHSAFEWLRLDDARRRLVWPGQRAGLEIVEKYIVGGEEAGKLTEIPL